MAKADAHTWEFKARFRRHAADGAVLFLEKVSAALEHVGGSSGAIGTAVNSALAELVPIIEAAPADAKTRDA